MMEPLLKAKEVARILNVSPRHVYAMAKRGQLPAVRIEAPGANPGRIQWRFKLRDVQRLVDANYNGAGR